MSTTVDQHYVQLYNSNVALLAMQEDGRLKDAVRNEDQEGEYAFYNQVGAIGYTAITGAAATTQNTPTHYRRRCGLLDYSIVPYLTRYDALRTGWVNPTSAYVRSSAATVNQIRDDALITAFDAAADTDKTGSTSTSYDTAMDITVVSGTQCTLAALIEAKEKLDANEVLSGDRYICLAAADLTALLDIQELTSSDYATVKALVQGEIDTFLGFKFIRSERLGVTSGTTRPIYYWQKESMLLAEGAGEHKMFTRIDELAARNYETQIYTGVSFGATRMDESGVGRILITD